MGMTLVRVHRALSHGWRTLEAATAEKEPSVLTRAHKCAASVAPPPRTLPERSIPSFAGLKPFIHALHSEPTCGLISALHSE